MDSIQIAISKLGGFLQCKLLLNRLKIFFSFFTPFHFSMIKNWYHLQWISHLQVIAFFQAPGHCSSRTKLLLSALHIPHLQVHLVILVRNAGMGLNMCCPKYNFSFHRPISLGFWKVLVILWILEVMASTILQVGKVMVVVMFVGSF